MHYYKFNIKAWTRETAHLTLEEEGVYRRLLDFYYDSECPIPVETKSVIRRLRLAGHEDAVATILSDFFVLESDGYHQAYCDKVIAAYHAKAEANRANGKKGGRPEKPKENPDGFQDEPTDNPNKELPITNKEQDKSSCDQQADSRKAIPYEKIFEAYATKLPDLPQLKVKDEARKRAIKSIWGMRESFQSVEFFERYFGYVAASEFLMTGVKAIGFDWLMKPANFKKVIEGNYHSEAKHA